MNNMGMVDISTKDATQREAIVEARVSLKPEVIRAIKKHKIPKGDVLETAALAGILASKKTSDIIPLCHPIPIEHVKIDFLIHKKDIIITSTVKGCAKTGVEMEAFIGAAVAALTIYDMCKPMDRDIVISEIKLLKKIGGKSGAYIKKLKT